MHKDPPVKRFVRRLNRIGRERPALGVRLAGWAGFLGQPWLGDAWSPSRDELEELFGPCGDRTRRRIQRRIAAGELRTRVCTYALQHKGPEAIKPLFEMKGIERLTAFHEAGRPVAVLVWNLGCMRGVPTALHTHGYEILSGFNRRGLPEHHVDPGYPRFYIGDIASRSQFLVEVLKLIERGGVPLIGVGPRAPQPRSVPFLNGSVPVPSGVGYLARRTDAVLMPATATWVGLSPRLLLTLHDPIRKPPRSGVDPEEWEHQVTCAAVRWFESYLRAHPEHLRPVNVRHMLLHLRRRPRAEAPVAVTSG